MKEAEKEKQIVAMLDETVSTLRVDSYHPGGFGKKMYYLVEDGYSFPEFESEEDAEEFKDYLKAWIQKARDSIRIGGD